jgi:ketosteroid isomerase-like protein
MSQQNVEIVRRLYEDWNRSGGVPPLERIDPEIEVDVRSGGLLEGTYRGHAGFSHLLESFWGIFEEHRIELEESIPAGDDVVLTVHYYGRGKTSGAEVHLREWHVWTLRDGTAVRWQIINTRKGALEAVGLSEQDAHADLS